jgi:hypothetical protein
LESVFWLTLPFRSLGILSVHAPQGPVLIFGAKNYVFDCEKFGKFLAHARVQVLVFFCLVELGLSHSEYPVCDFWLVFVGARQALFLLGDFFFDGRRQTAAGVIPVDAMLGDVKFVIEIRQV